MPLPPTITDASVALTFGAAGVYYGYATIADVSFEFPNKASFTTLSNSTIAQEIVYAGQEIQDLLATRYLMPYIGADGGILLTLRNLNAKLAAANIVDRYFSASKPDLSPAAAAMRSWVELLLKDLMDGVIQWVGTGLGDATAQPEKPSYPRAKGAKVLPDPLLGDEFAQAPVFTMGRSRYRRGSVF